MVKRERTAVLDVQVQAVGRGDRTDSGRVTRCTIVVSGQETGVLDGDHRRRGRRALHTQRTTLQHNSTTVEHQIGRDREGCVVKGERVGVGVVISSEVVATAAH